MVGSITSLKHFLSYTNCCVSLHACMQFFLHNVTEPRPQDPDNPVIPVEVPQQKISLVPFIKTLRKLRYIHIRLLYIWGIVLSHEDIVSLASVLCCTGY